MVRNEILKKIQDEGLAILKLHKRLEELNIEHEFVDRKEEQIKRIKEKKAIDVINEVCPFDYQIYIEENGNKISLIQSPYSYGIMENLIEAYNFQDEPIVLHDEIAATLISKKKLNSYIITINEKNDKVLEELKKFCNH
jgi:ribosomal protein L33